MSRSAFPSGPARFAFDALLALWIAWWVWLGASVGHEVRGLGELSTTATRLGHAVSAVGETLAGIPLVGGDIGPQLRAAGQNAVDSARDARASARRLGWMLGVSVALIPTLPVVLLYLPTRYAVMRERRALLGALRHAPAGSMDELLAQRAVVHLPYRQLEAVSDDPAGDLRAGAFARLADAELAWFGVSRRDARARPR